MNIIMSVKRPVELVNFGFVGDIKYVNVQALKSLLDAGAVPSWLMTHDRRNMLNTNADTIASAAAQALTPLYDVTLTFTSSMPGVLSDVNDPDSVIPTIAKADFEPLVSSGTVSAGMIPKLQNAFDAIDAGVRRVVITSASQLGSGTTIQADPETDD